MSRQAVFALVAMGAGVATLGTPLDTRAAEAVKLARPIKIGVLTDFGGPFAALTGKGAVLAARMAAADFGPIGGQPVEVVSADFQNVPDIGATVARRWFDIENVDAVVDIANSAVALAVSGIAKEKDKVFLASSAGTTALTGSRCSPNTVHWTYDTYMQAVAVAPTLVAEGAKTWYFLTADYAFGHDLQAVATDLIVKSGGTVVGSVRHPSSVSDFSSFLLSADGSAANVVAIASGGADVVNAVKQAYEFGLTSSGKRMATFLAPINTIDGLGLESAQGLYVSESFYWDLNNATRAWSQRFHDEMKAMPGMAHAGAYSATLHYLKAVDALVRSGEAPSSGRAAVNAMKRLPVDDPLFGQGNVRADGRVIHDTFLFQVKTPAESKQPWDYYKIVKRIPGSEAALPPVAACMVDTGR